MRKIVLLVIALVAGLIIAPDIVDSQGYVLISFANHTVDMSLFSLVLLVVLLIVVLFIVEFVIRKFFSISSKTSSWLFGRKSEKAQALTQTGLLKLLEGDWKQAEKLVMKGASHSEAPLLNYLAAAEAAQNSGDLENRDRYLLQAANASSDTMVASLTRAKLQYRQGQYEEALATLQELQEANPRNFLVLSLLKDTYIKLQDWQSLLNLLPTLKRLKMLDEAQTLELELQAEQGVMAYISTQKGANALLAYWKSLSRSARQQPQLVGCVVKLLVSHKTDKEAFAILKDKLKGQPDPMLVSLIPELTLSDYQPLITSLRNILSNDENNATALNALGQLYYRIQKWDEARMQFEKAVALNGNANNYAWLVDTLEKLGNMDKANEVARQALRQKLELVVPTP